METRTKVSTLDIIKFLNLEYLNAQAFDIETVCAPDKLVGNAFSLITRPNEFSELLKNAPENVLVIVPVECRETAKHYQQCFIISSEPRLSFVKCLHRFFEQSYRQTIAESAMIDITGKISKSVYVGENVVIKGNVDIGDNCIIHDNVVISGNVIIENNVKIKSGSIIGQKGFNFVYDENGIPLEFPHIGKVIIGNNVELGALNTVVQATLGETIIEDYVKTDDHVHIAHNVKIGYGTLITACAEISGSVTIGKKCWLGPNCSIIDHIRIGDNVTIGIGAVILKDVPQDAIIVGNPGKLLRYK